MAKEKKVKPAKPVPSQWPDLFLYYRGQKPDGNIQENNILLHNIPPLIEAGHFAFIQEYICKTEGFAMVRIIYWQRTEGLSNPPSPVALVKNKPSMKRLNKK